MKTLNEKFTDEEYEKLKTAKGTKSWHDFILEKYSPKQKKTDLLLDFDLDEETKI
jgi:predicted CopG family antitoxin